MNRRIASPLQSPFSWENQIFDFFSKRDFSWTEGLPPPCSLPSLAINNWEIWSWVSPVRYTRVKWGFSKAQYSIHLSCKKIEISALIDCKQDIDCKVGLRYFQTLLGDSAFSMGFHANKSYKILRSFSIFS